LPAVVEPDSEYTLRVDLFDRGPSGGGGFQGYEFGLYADGNPLAVDNSSVEPGDGLWETVTLTFDSTGSPYVGLPIEIRLAPTLGVIDFDNVRLGIEEAANAWANPSGGNWSEAANWSRNVVPNGSSARVDFGDQVATNAIITVDIPASVNEIIFDNPDHMYTLLGFQDLTLEGDAVIDVRSGLHNISSPLDADGTFTKRGPGSLYLYGSEHSLDVVNVASGQLVVGSDGSISGEEGSIGAAGETADVGIGGVGSSWDLNGELSIGDDGHGFLSIYADGQVTSLAAFIARNEGSTGFIWVDDGYLGVITDLDIGRAGAGALDILNGGSVSSGIAAIGREADGVGTVTVSGAGSTWTNAYIDVGREGTGTLIIEQGGEVISNSGSRVAIGGSLPSSATVTGSGSTWTNGGALAVGWGATGELTIEDGGAVESSGGRIGDTLFFAGSGTVTVHGAGSIWTNTGPLEVGYDGDGTLNVESGGNVSSIDGFIAYNPGSTGTVTVTGVGSTWTINDRLSIGGDGNTSTPGGTGALHINPGGMVNVTNDVVLFPSGVLEIAGGTLSANEINYDGGGQLVWTSGRLAVGTYYGNLVNTNGTLAPGNSPGITVVQGDYTQQAGGILEIEVGGLMPGTQHDQLQVSGTASLGGTLRVPIINAFTPTLNQTITFLTAGEVADMTTFSGLSATGLPANLALRVLYPASPMDPQEVRLQFVEPSTDIQFDSQAATPTWSDGLTWSTGTVPDTTHEIEVGNLSGAPQQVNVQNENAFTHRLTVESNTSPIAISIQNGLSLSATTGVTVGNNGTIELQSGNLVGSAVDVEPGGMITGNGRVIAELTVGAETGQAMLSPGLSATPIGDFEIEGDYHQMPSGTLEIDIHGDEVGEFDTVAVSGQAELGGTLRVDATDLGEAQPGRTYQFMTVGSVMEDSVFEEVVTIGRDDVYFAPIYPEEEMGSGSQAVLSNTLTLREIRKGDMNGDLVYDDQDVMSFALALTKPLEYHRDNGVSGQAAGDLDGYDPATMTSSGNGRLDFDDIDDFVLLINQQTGASTTGILAALDRHLQWVPEPSSLSSLVLSLLVMVCAGPRCRGLRQTHTA
jgi:T5SS/PEP-CTERM-associated repeat protein